MLGYPSELESSSSLVGTGGEGEKVKKENKERGGKREDREEGLHNGL